MLFYGKLPNKKERIILDNKIKEAYDTDFSYQFKLLNDNIEKFDSKPLALAEMLILSLSTLESNSDEENLDYPTLFTQCFVVTINLFNKYVGRDIALPDKNLSLIENWLMMIGKDYKDKILLKKFSRMLIVWTVLVGFVAKSYP